MLDNILYQIKKIIPRNIFSFLNPAYHWLLAYSSAIYCRFPSRKIKVIGVTGTKGKSTTTEILNAILEKAGYKTALSNTIRYKIGDTSNRNLFKMSTPGRFFLQKFLRQAVNSGCKYAILEITSQASLTFRHRFIELDTLIFTNLTPEHIEAHGSYENYRNAKLDIARNMAKSSKSIRTIIANTNDKESSLFLNCIADKKIGYSLKDAEPYSLQGNITFTYEGRSIHSKLQGLFNLYNILGAIVCAKNENVKLDDIVSVVESLQTIPGRVEKIEAKNFTVVVDYAHTTDSLRKLYEAFKGKSLIGVLGGTGGGRDVWKRKEMGKIADDYCKEIILTNEDPYDEDPMQIINDVRSGLTNHKPLVILDRREAIRQALKIAKPNNVVLITGKGTDPYIMGPNNSKQPWSDAEVVKEELNKLEL